MEREIIKSYPAILFWGDGIWSLIKAVSYQPQAGLKDNFGDIVLYPLKEGRCFTVNEDGMETTYANFPTRAAELAFAWHFCLNTKVEDLAECVERLCPRRIVMLDVHPWGNYDISRVLQEMEENKQNNLIPPIELQVILLTENIKYAYSDMSTMEQALQDATAFYTTNARAIQVREYSLENFDAVAFESFLMSGRGFVPRFLDSQRERLRQDSNDFQQLYPMSKEHSFTDYHSDTAEFNDVFRYRDEMKVKGCCTVLQQRMTAFMSERLYMEAKAFLESNLHMLYNESREDAFIGRILNDILQDLQRFCWQDTVMPVRDVLDYHAQAIHEKRLPLQQGFLAALDAVPDKLKTYIEHRYEESLNKIKKLRGNYDE